jgi:hypothetical protein
MNPNGLISLIKGGAKAIAPAVGLGALVQGCGSNSSNPMNGMDQGVTHSAGDVVCILIGSTPMSFKLLEDVKPGQTSAFAETLDGTKRTMIDVENIQEQEFCKQ